MFRKKKAPKKVGAIQITEEEQEVKDAVVVEEDSPEMAELKKRIATLDAEKVRLATVKEAEEVPETPVEAPKQEVVRVPVYLTMSEYLREILMELQSQRTILEAIYQKASE